MHASRSFRPAGLVAALALTLGTTGCFGGAEHEVTPTRPVIQAFRASPSSIAGGSAAILSWTVTGATSVSIAPGVGAVVGTSVAVTPPATTTYVLSATNAGGTSTASVTVTVTGGPPAPPAGLTYSPNPATYTVGQAITPNVPVSTGGAIAAYAVSPPLPAGLALNGLTGVITGTPTAAAASAAYTVTGSNGSGSTTASLTIEVVLPSLPTIVSFTAAPAAILVGETSLLSWDVFGATSLSIAPGVGAVTGTSVAVIPSATTTYVLSATNAGGTSTASVTVTVTGGPPAGLTYSPNPATYTVGQAITPNVPASTGGAIAAYAVSPPLPAGLALNGLTGVITGTPTAAAASAAYTVTGSNGSGSTTASLTIEVVLPSLPTIVSFTAAPAAILVGETSLLSWDVLGATSLSIAPGVGAVVGTSVAVTPSATTTYVLSATNAGGTSTASVTVTVTGGPPAGLTYSSNPATYFVGQAITPNIPSSTGGPIAAYAVSPPLPAGLTLDAITGEIGGTPTVSGRSALHAITGTNTSGTASTDLLLTVTTEPPAGFPVIFWFIATPASILQGEVASLAWDTQDAATLSIDGGVGIVTGTTGVDVTPEVPTTYTLTATNGTGTTTLSFAVTVVVLPPANLTYSESPAVYTVGVPIPANQPSSSGGAITGYAVNPPLPDGLSLDPVGGVITGVPLAATPQAIYTITGTNSVGSSSVELALTVSEPALAITTQPANQSALPGSTATFSVVATGVQPIDYEWRRDGVTVQAGELDFYTTPALQLADDGAVFDVVVTDATLASLVSSPAVLTLRGFTSVPGAMNVRRYGHTATLLDDGRVLFTGGNNGGASVASAETYVPSTRTFTVTSNSMRQSRQGHSAVKLPDGRVLVMGGCIAGALQCTSYLRTFEFFDPTTNTFTPAAPSVTMSSPRAYFAAALLPDGRVLATGGHESSSAIVSTAEIFDPVTGTFQSTGSMTTPRAYLSSSILPDGSVLVAGGQAVVQNVVVALSSTERYRLAASAPPSQGSFERGGTLASGRTNGSANALQDGSVLVAGGSASGITGSNRSPPALASAERVDGTGAISTGAMNDARNWQTSTRLPVTGEVLVTGGTSSSLYLSTAEIRDPVSGIFTLAPSMVSARAQHTATLLQDGTVLVVGGRDRAVGSVGFPLNTAELWAPYRGP